MTEPDRLRTRFLDAGMTVLARDGYPGFKQAAVCAEAGVTTGAFYHSFRNWKAFEAELITHWRLEATDRLVALARTVTDPHERIKVLTDIALNLPHATERAIGVWAATHPEIQEQVTAVEIARRDAIAEFATELFGAPTARRLAATAMLLLNGYQTSTDATLDDFEWALNSVTATALAELDERQTGSQTSE